MDRLAQDRRLAEHASTGARREDSMFDLDRLVADCRAALGSPSAEAAIKEMLTAVVARPADIEAALGRPRVGGISTLHHSPELTILNVVWAPGMAIYPHDHRMWAIIGLYGGREDNVFYRRNGGRLATAGGRELNVSDVAVLGRNVIHAVSNPLRLFTGAIHIYGGDFFSVERSEWTGDTLEERPYDMAHARSAFAEANARWARESSA
jgi:predicted metal-dependent enzyme (double-stranded beta helix superfamily)